MVSDGLQIRSQGFHRLHQSQVVMREPERALALPFGATSSVRAARSRVALPDCRSQAAAGDGLLCARLWEREIPFSSRERYGLGRDGLLL